MAAQEAALEAAKSFGAGQRWASAPLLVAVATPAAAVAANR